ncbi:GNAT family N-acetyltransferase [Natrinema caseinilyticum]|uniref:GNAT family N-acetyltransferase n=1 Tax=Natrinema caseinilyticum TaxID=2961570 RepID=UPI0020C1DA63|nr:hypothetical protein [Natrinema caseinilyticum]
MGTDDQRKAQGTPRFDQEQRYFSERQRRVYQFVREYEPVTGERLVQRFGSVTEQRGVVHHCAALKRLGFLAADGDRLRIGFDVETLSEPKSITSPEADVEVTIRPVRCAEYGDLRSRLRQHDGETPDVAAERIARRVASEGRLFRQDGVCERVAYAAYTADELRGWVLLSSSRPRGGHTVSLTSGARENRTRESDGGLERRLREYGLEWARSRGYGKVYRSLPATNAAAIETLESEGWEIDARREDRYRTESGPVDEVILAWRLDDGGTRPD